MRDNRLIYFGIVILLIIIGGLINCGQPVNSPSPSLIGYFVSTSGNDSNSGTTEALAWKTIQHAFDTLQAGDTVYIKGGTYNEGISTIRSGAAGAYITFSAYPGGTPIIDGTGITSQNNGIIITHSYIKLNGLHVRNWGDCAIWTVGAGYLEISNCEAYNVFYGYGFSEGTHDFIISNCVAHNFDGFGFDASPGATASCYNGTFNDCVAHTGRDPSLNVDGFALGHGTQNNFVFNRCTVYGVYDGFDISAKDTTLSRCSAHDCTNTGYKLWEDNITLVNCLGYNNTASNLEIDQNPGDTITSTATLRNCTFMEANNYNIWVEQGAYDTLHMYNCILAGGDNIGLDFYDGNKSKYQGDYNLFHNDDASRTVVVENIADYTFSGWQTASGQDSHSIAASTASEIFDSAVSPFDLHLKTGSPAINAGTSSNAPSIDYSGNPRPNGAGYDIGAYEK